MPSQSGNFSIGAIDTRRLAEQIAKLPTERIAEVEDFVEFLRSRDQARSLTRAAAQTSEAAFAAIWDNPEDAAYDAL